MGFEYQDIDTSNLLISQNQLEKLTISIKQTYIKTLLIWRKTVFMVMSMGINIYLNNISFKLIHLR